MPETLIHNHASLVTVLVYHQRLDIEQCACGWAELGESYAEHVAQVYEEGLRANQGAIASPSVRRVHEWAAEQLADADAAAAAAQRFAAQGTGQHAMTGYARSDERATTIRQVVQALTGWPS